MRSKLSPLRINGARGSCRTVPTVPGTYYWDEWKADVLVYRKKGGRHLYVTPPGGVEVRVTSNIAGSFRSVP